LKADKVNVKILYKMMFPQRNSYNWIKKLQLLKNLN